MSPLLTLATLLCTQPSWALAMPATHNNANNIKNNIVYHNFHYSPPPSVNKNFLSKLSFEEGGSIGKNTYFGLIAVDML